MAEIRDPQSEPAVAEVLASGPLSAVYGLAGTRGAVVVKLAPPEAVAREAAALDAVPDGTEAPTVLAAGAGVLVLSRLPGRHLSPAAVGPAELAALGVALRRLHGRPASEGRWPDWPTGERTLEAYEARVIAGVRAQAAPASRESVEDVLRRRAPLPAADAPFRSLHGDVWTGNVLWHGGRPAFVDWEYARPGDPAEELAYLIEMDALDDGQARALLEAYDVPEVAARVPAWRPLMALSAGLWYAELGVEDRARTLLAQAAAR